MADPEAAESPITAEFVCPTCGARFPPEQTWCPVCAEFSNGSCGTHD